MEKRSAPKRFAVGVNVIIQILLAGVILVFVNLGINRWHPPKMDLSSNDYYKLSDKTKQLLKSLKSPVEVIVFFQPPNEEDSVATKVFEDIQNLLKEYESASPNIKVKYVDPDRDPTQASRLADEYGVKVSNVVVFVFEKRSKYVQVSDLVEFDRMGGAFGGGERMKAFKGEQQFTSAIQNVLDAKQPKIYFLEGNGEGDPTNFDPRRGYSSIATYIRRDNLLVEKLNLIEKPEIPKDCDALIVCGPDKSFSDDESKAIHNYLEQNGRLMVLLDGLQNESGLDKFLSQYGIKVGNDLVLMKISDRLGGEALITSAPGTIYGNHPITEILRKERIATLFPNARSIDRLPFNPALKEKVTVLVQTPEIAWGETDLVRLQKDEKAQLDDKDRHGPVPLGVAVEPSTAGEMEREGMRMLVFGSSSFIRNSGLKGGNVDLFMNSLNWLLKRQQLIGIAPKIPDEFSLMLDVFQKRMIFSIEVVGLPLAMGVIGVLVWIKRRK